MKKFLSVTIAIILLIATLSGCQTSSSSSNSKPKPTTAEGIVKSLQNSNMPITKIEVYTEKNDPNKLLGRPGQYISKANFLDSRIDEPVSNNIEVINGGSIEVFANKNDAQKRYEYVSSIAQSSPMFNEYDYLIDKVLLRLSKNLTPEEAKEYADKLQEILK
ncbi:hypothetical protein Q3V94_08460 [Caloramator sp. CAR-1]|uniref:hypothetical protein n=1 Tax=Caloramator sp. CAR-1 TaxID=3062777 RepID=UPI0026E1D4D4|nr:hypothetical protein [Caloramator sp. CAR-1]MDO6355109.1 hypothetical protein [Caloramator sp. CAR-1]